MKNILLTLDYELYGNGSGDVFKHIIEPTEKILKIVNKYNAKITVFFEIVEYWKLKEEWQKGNKMEYKRNPIEAMEEQIRRIYYQGHDIQLHLHPQWVDASWVENGWKVNVAKWRLGDYEGIGDDSLVRLLQRGKETIERIINDGDYHCEVLRAGGYNVQPSGNLVEAMRKAGLKADSSIYPGGNEMGTLSRYDYTRINKNAGMWYCDKNLEIALAEKSDIIEIPIVAFPIVRLRKYLSIDRLRSLFRNRKSAKETFEAKTGGGKTNIKAKIQFFLRKEAQTWDYCLFSKSMHKKFLSFIKLQPERSVFVLVGHPKSFVSGKGLEYILKKAKSGYSFITISNLLNSL